MTVSNTITNYGPHRDIYRRLKTGLENAPDILDELLRSLGLLISEYDTSIRENRLIAGGAAEWLMATTMRSVGIANARARGPGWNDEGIVVDGHQISVKASFTGGRQAIPLINTLGYSGRTAWQRATIFILANRGIGYADPDLLPGAARLSGDVVILPRKPIDDWHDAQPQWLLPCAVPAKARDVWQRRAASEAVVTEILQRTARGQAMFPNLRQPLDTATD